MHTGDHCSMNIAKKCHKNLFKTSKSEKNHFCTGTKGHVLKTDHTARIIEAHHKKTRFLPMRKQRRRSALQ